MDLYFSQTLKIEEYDGLHLIQDHIGTNHSNPWNDYNYIVKFQLYYTNKNEKQFIGNLRLLINEIDDTSKFFIKEGEELTNKTFNINGKFSHLNAVSLPLDIDFYHKINKLFNKFEIEEILEKLCDASYYYQNFHTYKAWNGFTGSIMRDGTAAEAILKKGHQIAIGRYTPESSFEISLDLTSENIDPIGFYFDNNRDIGKTNINLLIGKNGAGKTFILKKLSEVITGITDIDEKWPYFHKLIVVAYSPFENFYTNENLLDELDKKYSKNKKIRKLKDKNRHRLSVNEYAYVGFRKPKGEFDIEWPKYHSTESLIKILKFDLENRWWSKKHKLQTLIDTLSLCIDFDYLAIKLKNKDELLPLRLDEQFTCNTNLINKEASKEDGIFFIKNETILNLSSGQKIYSYMIPAIVAEIEDESLIILDEPELYLHPTLEIELINMMKYLLTTTGSYAIIATHSAILAREVEKNGIKIIHNENNSTSIKNPSFETYGESLEVIIGEAFDDYITKKPFQDDLDQLIQKETPEKLLQDLSQELGDEALIYVTSKINNSNDIKFEDK